MALVNQTLSCTGTGSTNLSSQPSKVQIATGVSIPIINKLTSKTQIATGTGTALLLKVPGRILTSIALSDTIIFALRFGIDTFDIFEARRKWFIENIGKWEVKISKRFGFLVRGRPSG